MINFSIHFLGNMVKTHEPLLYESRAPGNLSSSRASTVPDMDAIHAEAIRNALSHARYTDTKTQYVAGVHFPYYERFLEYCDLYVDDEYKEGFARFIDPSGIRESLAEENIIKKALDNMQR